MVRGRSPTSGSEPAHQAPRAASLHPERGGCPSTTLPWYQTAGTPLLVIAGPVRHRLAQLGGQGTLLLGVKAVIAKSFERIHRSNLVGMGVLPLEFEPGQDAASLGLTGRETYEIAGIAQELLPHKKLSVKARHENGEKTFTVKCRIDTPNELDYYRHGGILQFVLRQLALSPPGRGTG